jgi:hypothetical protein
LGVVLVEDTTQFQDMLTSAIAVPIPTLSRVPTQDQVDNHGGSDGDEGGNLAALTKASIHVMYREGGGRVRVARRRAPARPLA